MREATGKRFEPWVTQLCIFHQINCTLVAEGLGVVTGWQGFFYFAVFDLFFFFSYSGH